MSSEENKIMVVYSRKYWRELNLAVEPKITIARILADFKFGGCNIDRQTAKFTGYTIYYGVFLLFLCQSSSLQSVQGSPEV